MDDLARHPLLLGKFTGSQRLEGNSIRAIRAYTCIWCILVGSCSRCVFGVSLSSRIWNKRFFGKSLPHS